MGLEEEISVIIKSPTWGPKEKENWLEFRDWLEAAGAKWEEGSGCHKVTFKVKLTVRRIAERIIEKNASYYPPSLLQVFPKELLNTELNYEDLNELGAIIDEIRFQKEKELAAILQLPPLRLGNIADDTDEMKKLRKVINSPIGSLPEEQENKRKEIKFLFNVAATIIHQ
jgi:hypothetical protein